MYSLTNTNRNLISILGFVFILLIGCSTNFVQCSGDEDSSGEEVQQNDHRQLYANILKSKKEQFLRNLFKLKLLNELQNNNDEEWSSNDDEDNQLDVLKRSPIVFPRIGAEKKRAIIKPRIGRNFDLSKYDDSNLNGFDDNFISEDKRAIYKPRVGK